MNIKNSFTPDFRDQVAVVTGANSGIGKAIALCLLDCGATLYLVDKSLDKLEAVAESALKQKSQVNYYRSDLSIDKEIVSLSNALKIDCSSIDILIHSAGIISLGRFETSTIEDFDKQYRINVRAPYFLTQALLPLLKQSKGQIVFINSSVSLTNGKANSSQYCATKHALKAIADSLRDEVNTEGIRVLSIYPGRTATPMQAAVHEQEGKEYHPERLLQPIVVAESVVQALSLPRTAEVTDISIRPFFKS